MKIKNKNEASVMVWRDCRMDICFGGILLKILLSFVSLASYPHSLFAQSNIPVGSWKFHQSYLEGGSLSGSDQTIFYQGAESIYYFSVNEDVTYPITKNEGLYGQHFSASAFDHVSKNFLIAYPDGTLDRIGENRIQTITSLRENKQILGKGIKKIKLVDRKFYLAADFGVAIVDPGSGQFLDAYINIGPGGTSLAVIDLAFDLNHMFLATPLGILKGNLGMNLKDFRNWYLLETPVEKGFVEVENIGEQLFFLGADQQLYAYEEDEISLILGTAGSRNLKSFGNEGYYSNNEGIFKLETNGSFSLFLETNGAEVSDFHLSADDLYLSIPGRGVVRQGDGKQIAVPGPATKIQQFYWDGEIFGFPLYKTVDGVRRTSGELLISKLENGTWDQQLTPDQAITRIKFQNATYFASHRDGIWREENGQFVKLVLPFEGRDDIHSVFARDHKNQLWVGFGDNAEFLLKINASGNVELVPVSGLNFPHKIVVDNGNNLWILQAPPSGGSRLRVFNEDKNLNRLLGASSGQGGIPAGQVLDLDLDLNDNLWLGLTNGVAYLPNVSRLGAGSEINVILPIFESANLLSGQAINAVQVAPDQTKWFGSANDGLWHFSAYGESLLEHFKRDNSPMSSNTVLNLEIDPLSGELLMVLPDAAISYRGWSTQAEAELSMLKIFPNPVRPDFSGLLSIEGLTDFATIKITNSAGRMVYSGQVRGGKATWDLRSGQSGKVAPGVYLVFVLDGEGFERVAGKFVVI